MPFLVLRQSRRLYGCGLLKGARSQPDSPKDVNVHVYEHVHVNDHGFADVDVDVYVLVLVDGFFKISKRE